MRLIKLISDKLTFKVEESSDPNYPGVYLYAMHKDKKGEEEEVGCILMELDDGIVKARVWNHESMGNDPKTTHLFVAEKKPVGYQVTGTRKDYLWDGDHVDLPYIPSWIVFNKEDAERLVEYAHDRNWKDASLDEIFNGDIEDPTFAKVDDFI